MYEELVESLKNVANEKCFIGCFGICNHCEIGEALNQAADAIEELTAKINSLQFFVDNISKLPDCNTCLKKNLCEFKPKYGEYCRINCPLWLGEPQLSKVET